MPRDFLQKLYTLSLFSYTYSENNSQGLAKLSQSFSQLAVFCARKAQKTSLRRSTPGRKVRRHLTLAHKQKWHLEGCSFLQLCSRQESNITCSVQVVSILFRSSQNTSQPFRLLTRRQNNSPKKLHVFVFSSFILCSRQESNLEFRYRKPMFYPLNYESKRDSFYLGCECSSRQYNSERSGELCFSEQTLGWTESPRPDQLTAMYLYTTLYLSE